MRTRRYVVASAILLVLVALALIPSNPTPVSALEETLVPPDGREQLPLIYVHGFNDDGAS
ncbi:MAG: hypothetical protein QGG34_02690 [SAR202 cluster bacterium]|nr:hypothetical protein [SAR202 cluster bacterium]MDP6299729.1 hypothetical protein [SAR202 cluster bacterium]MDP7102275.1 hypothetical protein [SAR202 cluster bacterium]MDP7224977.1 hypothetical protein [SAR202 cluster bacterium]MDP7414201.1 hypothetical protein [SAR202 cluster bacterium]